jgi:hypothetical protein
VCRRAGTGSREQQAAARAARPAGARAWHGERAAQGNSV